MKRSARIALIKLQVRAGTYEIDPEAVAEAMLNRARRRTSGPTNDRHSQIRALDYNGVSHPEIARQRGLDLSSVNRILSEHQRPAVQSGRRAAA